MRPHAPAARGRASPDRGKPSAGELVDHVSFIVMRSRGVDTALAFDPDFEAEGFRLF
jgi:predicted nucleic acid-binding protein